MAIGCLLYVQAPMTPEPPTFGVKELVLGTKEQSRWLLWEHLWTTCLQSFWKKSMKRKPNWDPRPDSSLLDEDAEEWLSKWGSFAPNADATPSSPEKYLWLRVLLLATADALLPDKTVKGSKVQLQQRDEARAIIFSNHPVTAEHFEMICHMAGTSASLIRRRIKQCIDDKDEKTGAFILQILNRNDTLRQVPHRTSV